MGRLIGKGKSFQLITIIVIVLAVVPQDKLVWFIGNHGPNAHGLDQCAAACWCRPSGGLWQAREDMCSLLNLPQSCKPLWGAEKITSGFWGKCFYALRKLSEGHGGCGWPLSSSETSRKEAAGRSNLGSLTGNTAPEIHHVGSSDPPTHSALGTPLIWWWGNKNV